MEIIKKNFMDSLPLVKDAIKDCDFLAIDTELTGLSTSVTEHAFDTISERYSKYRDNCLKFIIIQFGVSTFKYHAKQNKYTHKDFNFYIFPRPHIRQAPDPKFMCQTSSLHFLASQDFDFNKVIYDGIQYLTPAHELQIKEVLDKKHKNEQEALNNSKNGTTKANGQREIAVPSEHKHFVAEVLERVESFLSNEGEKTIELEPCSSYQRKLIYDTVQFKHQTGIEMSTKMNKDNKRVIAIEKSTDEERQEKLNLKQDSDLGDLDIAVGFRKVLDLISESKKLVIGHNMLLDMMHSLDQFFAPVPESLDEFKEMLHMTFPQIMDTKLLASSENLKPFFESTQLGEVAKTLQGKAFNMPTVEPADSFKGYTLECNKVHEAGFDAFLTGFSYIGMISKLASLLKVPVRYSDPHSNHLKPYVNRIFIMWHYDIGALNICAPDPEPNRDNVFYVSFPQEWKTNDLVELFSPYGDIYVNWLDDVSALVALKNRESITKARADLLNKPGKLYKVRTFSDYQKATNKHIKKNADAKRTQTSSANSDSSGSKKRSSGNTEAMDLIPAVDENEAEKADDSVSTSHESKSQAVKSKAGDSAAPLPKRQKRYQEENEAEVSSTAKVFEEENTW